MRLQAATVGDDDPVDPPVDPVDPPDGEELELRALRDRAEFAPYLSAALEHRGLTEGAEAELNAALDVPADRFPLELLAPPEERAAVDGDAAATQSTWIDRLFADTAAMQLGVTMPSVAPGVASFPVLGSTANPAQRGRAEDAATAVISANVTEIKPTRNAVHAVYSIEDDARLPGLADAIRRDLAAAMTEKIDRTIFRGDSTAGENVADIVGLQTAGIDESTLTQANKVKADEVLELLSALVDGQYAASMADLNIVASVGTNSLWVSTMPVTNHPDTIALILRSNGVTWTTRGQIEANTANNDFGAYIGLARGIENAAVAPVWNSAQMIVDPYSGAKSGEVELTLSYLWGFKIPRTNSFKRIKYVA